MKPARRMEIASQERERRAARVFSTLLVLILVAFNGLGRDLIAHQLRGGGASDPTASFALYGRFLFPGAAILLGFIRYPDLSTIGAVPRALIPTVALALLSTFWSVDPKVSLQASLEFLLLFLALASIRRAVGVLQMVRVTVYLIIAVVTVSAAVAILFPTLGRHQATDLIQSSHAGQWKGIFVHKNGLGAWAAFSTALVIPFRDQLKLSKASVAIGFSCGLLCLVFSNSQTSLLAAVLMIAVIALLSARMKLPLWVFWPWAAVAFGSVALALGYVGPLVLNAVGRDQSLTGRTEIWPLAAKAVEGRPLLGYGFATSGGGPFQDMTLAGIGIRTGPESGYWKMLLDVGWTGCLLFFLASLFVSLQALHRFPSLSKTTRAAIAVPLAATVGSFLLNYTEATMSDPLSYVGSLTFTLLFCLCSGLDEGARPARRRTRTRLSRFR